MNRRAAMAWLMAAACCAGCKTAPDPPEGAVPAGTVIPFKPANAHAALQFDGGRYPALLANDSYALWVDDGVSIARMEEARAAGEAPDAESTAMAAALDAAFHVFELHLNSRFADSAIAYDVVGLQGVDVYLELANGASLRPARTAMGDLEEGRENALLTFSRTVLLGFPRDSLEVTVTADEAAAASVRLVVEGHGTKYYFEWFPMLPEAYLDSRALQRRQFNAAKMRFDTYYQKLRQWAHNFD